MFTKKQNIISQLNKQNKILVVHINKWKTLLKTRER